MTASQAVAPSTATPVRVVTAAALSLALVFSVYASTLSADFVWDDVPLIVENPAAHQLTAAVQSLLSPFWNDDLRYEDLGYFRPLVALSYALDWQLSNGASWWFHGTNLLLHAANVFLLLLVFLRRGWSLVSALPFAALFALTARGVENVAWVSGRTDVLATVWVLLAITALERSALRFTVAFVGAALFSKEVGVAALLAMAVVTLRHVPSPRRVWVGLATVGALYLAARVASHTPAAAIHLAPVAQALTIGHGVADGAAALLSPWAYNFDYPGLLTQSTAWALLGWLLLAGLGGLLLVLLRGAALSKTLVFFGITGVVAFVLPMHLVAMPYDRTGADRFLYLPLACLVGALSHLRVGHLRTGVALVLAVVAGLSGLQTSKAARVWQSSLTLWFDTVHRGSTSETVFGNVATALSDATRCDEALPWFERAEAQAVAAAQRLGHHSETGRTRSMHGRAKCLEQMGRFSEALSVLDEVIRLRPDWKRPRYNRVLMLLRARRFDEAQVTLAALQSAYAHDTRLEALSRGLADARAQFTALETLGRAGHTPAFLDQALTATLEQNMTADALSLADEILAPASGADLPLKQRALATLVTHGPRARAAAALSAPELQALDAATRAELQTRFDARFAESLQASN